MAARNVFADVYEGIFRDLPVGAVLVTNGRRYRIVEQDRETFHRFFALTTAPLTEQTDGGFGQNNYLRWIAGTRDYSGASFLYDNLKIVKDTGEE